MSTLNIPDKNFSPEDKKKFAQSPKKFKIFLEKSFSNFPSEHERYSSQDFVEKLYRKDGKSLVKVQRLEKVKTFQKNIISQQVPPHRHQKCSDNHVDSFITKTPIFFDRSPEVNEKKA